MRFMSSLEDSSISNAKLLNKGRVKGTSCPSSVNASSCRVSTRIDGCCYVVKANASAKDNAKLRDEEIIPQMR